MTLSRVNFYRVTMTKLRPTVKGRLQGTKLQFILFKNMLKCKDKQHREDLLYEFFLVYLID